MNRDDIIRMAREAGMALGFTQGIAVMNHENLERLVTIAEDAQAKRMFEEGIVTVGYMRHQVAAERNKVASWMMAQGYATGHGDTTEDLLQELGAEINDRIRAKVEAERERIIAANAPEIERVNAHIKELEDAVKAERNRLKSAAECFRMCEHKGVCDEKAKSNETDCPAVLGKS